MLNFDESGFWFWNREFGFCGNTRLPTQGISSSKWISIRKSSSGFHGFLCFAFFREIQKGSLLGGVSMRLTVGYKKKRKIALDFLMKIHLEDRFFIIEIRFCFSFLNTKSVFQNSNSDLPIESTHEPFSQYSTSIRSFFGFFWIEIRLFLHRQQF